MSGGDGRLELDELGDVIDQAAKLDSTAETLEGADGEPWSARLADTAIGSWARRHPVVVGVLAAGASLALVGGVGATTYLRSQPPPDDGVVAARVIDTDNGDGSTGGVNGPFGHLLTGSFNVLATRPGDRVELVGIRGPGIEESSALGTPAVVGNSTKARYDINAAVDCLDPASVLATDDYRAVLRRTDSLGRIAVAEVPLPKTGLSPWAQTVAAYCLMTDLAQGAHLVSMSSRIDAAAGRRSLLLDLGVTSRLGYAVSLSAPDEYQGGTVRVLANNASVPLAPGATAHLHLRMQVDDCRAPSTPEVPVPLVGADSFTSAAGAVLEATVVRPGATADPGGGTSADPAIVGVLRLTWTPAQTARLDGLLRGLCAGAPSTSMHVLSARPAPASVVAAAESATGFEPALVLRTTLDVRTDASRVTVADAYASPDSLPGQQQPFVSTGSAPVVGGHARVSVDWVASCDSIGNPPTVRITATTRRGAFPSLETLGATSLSRAVLASCALVTGTDLTSMGWPVAAG